MIIRQGVLGSILALTLAGVLALPGEAQRASQWGFEPPLPEGLAEESHEPRVPSLPAAYQERGSEEACPSSFGQRFAFAFLGTGVGAALGALSGEAIIALPPMVLLGAGGTMIPRRACDEEGFEGAVLGASVGAIPLVFGLGAGGTGGEGDGTGFGALLAVAVFTIPFGAAVSGGG